MSQLPTGIECVCPSISLDNYNLVFVTLLDCWPPPCTFTRLFKVARDVVSHLPTVVECVSPSISLATRHLVFVALLDWWPPPCTTTRLFKATPTKYLAYNTFVCFGIFSGYVWFLMIIDNFFFCFLKFLNTFLWQLIFYFKKLYGHL